MLERLSAGGIREAWLSEVPLPERHSGGQLGEGRQLDRLFAPRSVAIVGASPESRFGKMALTNPGLLGFTGRVYGVNPLYDEVEGLPCFPSLSAIDDTVDAVGVAVSARRVETILADVADCGIPNAVVYAGGLGEGTVERTGGQAVASLIASRRLNVVGPNCLGLINYAHRSSLWANPIVPARAGTREGVALIAQSGNVALSLISGASSMPLSHVVSCGNQMDLTAADLLGYLVEQPEVRVVALVLEGVPDVERLKLSLERAIELDKPIVVLKVGTSAAGMQAAVAHTGTLSGPAESYRAFFRQYCVTAVDSLDELVSACVVLSAPRRIRGKGLVVLASSGGECGLVADAATETGMSLPPIPPPVASELSEILPDYASILNPLDVTSAVWGDVGVQKGIVEMSAKTPGADAVVYVTNSPVSTAPDGAGWHANVAGIAQAATELPVPVFALSILANVDAAVTGHLLDAGVTPLCGLQSSLKALALSSQREDRARRWLDRSRRPTESSYDPVRQRQAVDLLNSVEGSVLGETPSKALLELYGIGVPPGALVGTADEAVRAAQDLGLQVVMKLEAEGLYHKSDIGAVSVGVDSVEAVRSEFERLVGLAPATAGSSRPAVRVERCLTSDVELILGMKRERDLGPVVILGFGGVLVEVLNDTSRRLAPLTAHDVEEMVTELRGARLLHGHRGAEAVDLDQLSSFVVAFSDMVTELPEVVEIDLNPIAYSPDLASWVALDALFVKRG
jgi:acetate---CoA ligase (ADP-forming)